MARPKKIEISALNIKLQPHKPELYVALLRDTFKLQQVTCMRSDYYGVLGTHFVINKGNPLDGYTGYISKFLQIDPEKPWFNTKNNKKAEQVDVNEVNIPDHLKPNMENFRYVFYPVGHRLFFETSSDGNTVGPSIVLKFFKSLFEHEKIVKKYGEVTVILEPSVESLKEIFSIHTLKRLDMTITKPNPDDPFENFEHTCYERMNAENADVYETGLKGIDLAPSDETKMLARVAASNGVVKGEGSDFEGTPVKRSTKEHPLRKRYYYDPDIETQREVFLYKASEMLENIRDWLGGK